MSSVAERIWRWNSAPQGIKEFPQERALQIQHIRLLCQDPSVDRGICAQTIREYLGRDSTLADSEEFQKLQKEYGIKVEEKRYGSENEEHCGFTDGAGAAVLAAGRAGL